MSENPKIKWRWTHDKPIDQYTEIVAAIAGWLDNAQDLTCSIAHAQSQVIPLVNQLLDLKPFLAKGSFE